MQLSKGGLGSFRGDVSPCLISCSWTSQRCQATEATHNKELSRVETTEQIKKRIQLRIRWKEREFRRTRQKTQYLVWNVWERSHFLGSHQGWPPACWTAGSTPSPAATPTASHSTVRWRRAHQRRQQGLRLTGTHSSFFRGDLSHQAHERNFVDRQWTCRYSWNADQPKWAPPTKHQSHSWLHHKTMTKTAWRTTRRGRRWYTGIFPVLNVWWTAVFHCSRSKVNVALEARNKDIRQKIKHPSNFSAS